MVAIKQVLLKEGKTIVVGLACFVLGLFAKELLEKEKKKKIEKVNNFFYLYWGKPDCLIGIIGMG